MFILLDDGNVRYTTYSNELSSFVYLRLQYQGKILLFLIARIMKF